ncbi:Alpha/Beta hydrolase protein [Schizophyllum amplum]|uniref:Carboxypeptidase n=1 Tax=Schizophyllum amplum TaxID=97359 RepID=A0A550CCA8_9AGAR|nr:Alpha/Beta hydrolase protein [Auriculariopsis ampla]
MQATYSRMLVAVWVACLCAIASASAQSFLHQEAYDAGLFTPLETLDALSEAEFTSLSHPFFPDYGVRVKKTKFCDGTVNSYTGYLDITKARHLFFYFFESRNDPAADDVIFWTNGGPGASSSLGLFMELGPCRVLDENGAKYHPESWNSNANIFFIDQPIGVGFSYADYGETAYTTDEAAKDVAAFVAIFFEHFSQFKGRPFHMAGESYGGRYLPVFASAIYDQNTALVQAGMTPVNLTSVMIGNGITDPFRIFLSYYDMQCTGASVDPVVDIATCVYQKKMVKRCEKWFQESCIDQYDAINCGSAVAICQNAISAPFLATGMNPYDISQPCNGSVATTLCYPLTVHISNYLSAPSLRAQLGVDPAVPANFSSVSMDVSAGFNLNQDSLHASADYVGALLERGVRVLIYVGDYDWICNWIGNERFTLALEWSGQADFGKYELRDWFVGGAPAGKTRSTSDGLFTFATIAAAGHMVPYDKPKESLELVNRWMKGEPF